MPSPLRLVFAGSPDVAVPSLTRLLEPPGRDARGHRARPRPAPWLARLDTPAVVQRIATRDLDLPTGTAVQLWPHRHGTDAMFIQLLAK